MATLEKEDFWGCELKKGSNEVKFNPEFEDSELSEVEHKLILSQACLGAKSSGRCLVEVTAHDYKGDEMKNVIVCLQQGSTEMCPLNLSFNPPATFKLIEGPGPVYLSGNHIQSLAEDELDSSEESDDEEQAPQLVDSKAAVKSKRPLPASTPSGPPKKMAKTTKEDDDEDDDEDEESSDDEEEEEEEEPAKPSKPKKDVIKENGENDEDDEDDDEDDMEYEEDDDDDDSDEDEDSEDEEESDSDEEESDEVTKNLTGKKDTPKKPMTNGISSQKEEKKTPSKSQQKTPQPKADKPKDLDSIKKALLKSPSLPKKIEKFKNFMRSSYKITDEKTVNDVWEYIQNNKK